MFIRIGCSLTEVLILFSCGLLIGSNINIATKLRKTATSAVQVDVTNVSSTELVNDVKILCLILTSKPNHAKRAIHLRNTWGSRCNKLIFVSNVTDVAVHSLKLQEHDHYDTLWGKTKHALVYAYENFYDDYDWFFKADDDTYAIMDNMRFMLSACSPDDPIYFGKKFNYTHDLGYFSGGAGYVMSRKALKKFVTEALHDEKKCRRNDDGNEDWELGICMHNIGVYPGDARDRFQRETFLPFHPDVHFFSYGPDWYWERLYYPNDDGLDCCSNSTITFHYIGPEMMYLLEFLLLNLKAYGVRHTYDPMPEKKNFTVVVQTLLAERVNKTKVSE